MPTLTKTARLRLFREALLAAPPAGSPDEALALIVATLNDIEDLHSGVPYNPELWETDGRMYPPNSAMARPSPEYPGATAYRARAHRTVIAPHGAFAIFDLRQGLLFVEKPDRNGLGLQSAHP